MPSDSIYHQNENPQLLALNEQGIEDLFIGKLRDLKYTDRPDIHDRASLEKNFREKFESLNRVRLTDAEFARLLEEIVTPDVFTAAKTLRQINAFSRDDATPLNYTLVNIKDWCKNTFEVVSQLRINTDYSHHRYDILLLINGVPCVQIELKTLGIHPRRAMEQIVDYKNDPGNGYTKTLLCFLQLFIVSNRDSTYYFANNNARHFSFNQDERFLPIYQFADEANKKIAHLDDFAATFLVKCTLGHTISRYMVLIQSEQKLLMMRPYQVYAVKHLVTCIQQDSGNGFIWHTTGSGKTLTSFKAATLLKDNPDLAKCLFVVDRKDLDRQTREEFNRFQEGCVEENTNTAALVRRLLSEDYADKVIVTTIQKLGLALDETSKRNQQRKKNDQPTYKEMLAPLSNQRIAFIFDECHRSQFGENHKAIKEFFPRAQLFGFTGTPIIGGPDGNASRVKVDGEVASYQTTEDLFQFHATEHAVVATPKKAIDVGWLYYSLDLLNLNRFATGQAQPGLSVDVLENVALAIPPTEPEQQKIADCLSSVDELIAAQARKLDALKTHKKGLMQQLFPREGETQPRLRFLGFQNAGEWVAKRLSGLIDLISGMHLSPADYSTSGEVPYFTGPSDFTNDLQTVTKWTKRTANVSQAGDTLITVKGSGVGEIWYSTLPEVALGRQLMAIRSKNGSSRFMFQFLLTKRSRFEDLGSGNLIPGLSRAVILELEAYFPAPAEQQRIADCLTSLDDLIAAQTQTLEALKTHKQGLMQQLFPNPSLSGT